MIKYQVQAREIASKDKDIQDLQRKLAEAEIVIQEQQNKINHMEGHVKRLEVSHKLTNKFNNMIHNMAILIVHDVF